MRADSCMSLPLKSGVEALISTCSLWTCTPPCFGGFFVTFFWKSVTVFSSAPFSV
jgi:hypothetical protein